MFYQLRNYKPPLNNGSKLEDNTNNSSQYGIASKRKKNKEQQNIKMSSADLRYASRPLASQTINSHTQIKHAKVKALRKSISLLNNTILSNFPS